MKHLPFVAFAAAIAIWGLPSVPDGGAQKSSSINGVESALTQGHGQAVGTPRLAFEAPTREVAGSLLLMAGLTFDRESLDRAEQANPTESRGKGR
jgi:hypothetical protein